MPPTHHHDYRYSITIHTDDAALAVSMRALAWFCQKSGNKQIVNAGNGLPKWQSNGHKITFYFNSPLYRADFLKESERLFRGAWDKAEERDDDPAPRQS
jgi:hypothetical protein